MTFSRQYTHCLVFFLILILTLGCEQKTLNINTENDGLNLVSELIDGFNTYTNQPDTLKIGNSLKLYLGKLDSIRDSKILFNINPEILHSSNICADSTALLSSTLRLRSVNDVYTPIGELNDGEYNSSLERGFENITPQFSAYYSPDLDSIYGWYNDDIFFNKLVDLNQLELIPLIVSVEQYHINIHLNSLFESLMVLDSINLCNYGEPINILLLDNENIHLREFYSSEFVSNSYSPSIKSNVEYNQVSLIEKNRISIESIGSQYLDHSVFAGESDESGLLTGKFKSLDPVQIIDNPYLISLEDTSKDIEFLELNFTLNENIEDSSNTIELFFFNLKFSNQLIFTSDDLLDPAQDNWNNVDSNNTENNNLYDYGELFLDCGNDNLCDEDEPGYFPNGLENNNLYDYGELFLDCGIDSLCNEDEIGYDPIMNTDPAGDDYNLDPNLDNWMNTSLTDSFYIFNQVILLDSILCVNEYNGNSYYTHLSEANNNLHLADLWCSNGDNSYCSFCDTLVFDVITDSTLEYSYGGTENNNKWDYVDLNQNGIFDNEDTFEQFNDLGFDNYPELEGNESSDIYENNGVWDFLDVNNNGYYDLGEPHENFYDCGVDNVCDINEIGYNPNGTEKNLKYDYREYFEDCGLDMICNEIPDIDDFVLDPSQDNWNISDSSGTEGNNIRDSLETFYDWGLDQLQDSLELPFQRSGGNLEYSLGLNSWQFPKDLTDSTYQKPTTDDSDLVLWVSSIERDNQNLKIMVSLNSKKTISHLEFEIGHTPFFEYFEEVVSDQIFYTNNSLELIDGSDLISDISVYPKSNITFDTTNFHLNYSDNYSTKIEIPEINMIINENLNKTVSEALIYLNIDTSNYYHFIDDAGVKVKFSKFNSLDLDPTDKTLIASQIVRNHSIIEIDFTSEMQKLLTGESKNNGFLLEASEESNNFSQLVFFNERDSLNKPKLEIMMVK